MSKQLSLMAAMAATSGLSLDVPSLSSASNHVDRPIGKGRDYSWRKSKSHKSRAIRANRRKAKRTM